MSGFGGSRRKQRCRVGIDGAALRRLEEASDGAAGKEVFITQSYAFGEEAHVGWYEAYAEFEIGK